jgi:hypothetical protein
LDGWSNALKDESTSEKERERTKSEMMMMKRKKRKRLETGMRVLLKITPTSFHPPTLSTPHYFFSYLNDA